MVKLRLTIGVTENDLYSILASWAVMEELKFENDLETKMVSAGFSWACP